MKAISLCSGMDGFGFAASLLGIEVTAHVEIDPVFDEHYKRHWPGAKRFYDLRSVTPQDLGPADIVFGGEPCQGNSVAGLRKGMSDDRFLWPDYLRICKGVRPTWIINENVTGSISNLVLDAKIADLESEGYSTRAFNIPACAVGAYHERQRVWLIAHSNSQRRSIHTNSPGVKGSSANNGKPLPKCQDWKSKYPVPSVDWFSTPDVANLTNGIRCDDVPTELAELKAYGNAVVPWIPYVILSMILEVSQ